MPIFRDGKRIIDFRDGNPRPRLRQEKSLFTRSDANLPQGGEAKALNRIARDAIAFVDARAIYFL